MSSHRRKKKYTINAPGNRFFVLFLGGGNKHRDRQADNFFNREARITRVLSRIIGEEILRAHAHFSAGVEVL